MRKPATISPNTTIQIPYMLSFIYLFSATNHNLMLPLSPQSLYLMATLHNEGCPDHFRTIFLAWNYMFTHFQFEIGASSFGSCKFSCVSGTMYTFTSRHAVATNVPVVLEDV